MLQDLIAQRDQDIILNPGGAMKRQESRNHLARRATDHPPVPTHGGNVVAHANITPAVPTECLSEVQQHTLDAQTRLEGLLHQILGKLFEEYPPKDCAEIAKPVGSLSCAHRSRALAFTSADLADSILARL